VSDDTEEPEIGTANTMRERAGESHLKLRVLLRTNRLVITAILTVFVFVSFVGVVSVLEPPFAQQVRSGDTLDSLFTTMITVIVTGTTLVVTIGQLVLSQENGPLGDQRERMSNAMDFREYTEELIGAPAPADPSAFLRELVDLTEQRATELRNSLGDEDDDELKREVDEFTDSVIGNSETVRDQLEGATFGSFNVLFAALNYNYGWKIFQVERLATDHAESLSENQTALMEDLKTSLVMFGPAREHIKTLYFQWALIDLSQLILYAAIPALTVAGIMVGVVEAATFPGTTLGIANILWVVGGAFAVTVVPFMLFVSYVIRIVTIAKRTLAIDPLILRDSQR
jgi:hypothetical protein